MDNASRLTILAAQYAGDSPNSVVSGFLAPGASAAIFCVGIIVVIGIVIGILDHFIDKKQLEIWKEIQYDEKETKRKDKKDVR